jgi:hypothetical protein
MSRLAQYGSKPTGLGGNPTQNLASIPENKSPFKSEHFCVSYALQTIHLFQFD